LGHGSYASAAPGARVYFLLNTPNNNVAVDSTVNNYFGFIRKQTGLLDSDQKVAQGISSITYQGTTTPYVLGIPQVKYIQVSSGANNYIGANSSVSIPLATLQSSFSVGALYPRMWGKGFYYDDGLGAPSTAKITIENVTQGVFIVNNNAIFASIGQYIQEDYADFYQESYLADLNATAPVAGDFIRITIQTEQNENGGTPLGWYSRPAITFGISTT
jgi:hypothetical protein